MSRFPKRSLAAFLNFLLAKYEAYSGRVEVAARPCYAMIDPCDLCQLRCPTCPTGIENEGRRTGDRADTTYRTDRSMMAPSLFDALLEEMGESLFLVELYSWGEPLLSKHVGSLVRRAAAQDIEVHLHTNLSLPLSDERIDELVSCGLTLLVASVDGFTQGTYERFRVGGDVELVKSNLLRLAAARERLGSHTAIVYKFLIFEWNEHELPAAEAFAREAGVVFLRQDSCVPDRSWLPRHRVDEKPVLSSRDLVVLQDGWSRAGKPGYFRAHEMHPYFMPVESGTEWIPRLGSDVETFCGWHYSTAVIQPGGHVAPCCVPAKEEDRFGRVVPGEVSFATVWNDAPYRASRAAFSARPAEGLESVDTICARCYLPGPLRHAHRSNDFKVLGQFEELFAREHPVLAQAFALLSGPEDRTARLAFVRFFEERLGDYFPAGVRRDGQGGRAEQS